MKASAIVTVVLDVDVGDSWGGECSVSQVQSQAKEAALRIVRRLIEEQRGVKIASATASRVVLADEGAR